MQHDPVEFVQYTDMYGHPRKYVIEEDRISSLQFYKDGTPFLAPMVTRLRGFEDGIRIAINRDFGEGSARAYRLRNLLQIDKRLEKITWDMIELQRLESKDTRIRDVKDEIDALTSEGYRLFWIISDAIEDGEVPEDYVTMREKQVREKILKLQNKLEDLKKENKKTYMLPYESLEKIEKTLKSKKKMFTTEFKGLTNVCKIIFGEGGETVTFYRSFTVDADGEPYGQKHVGRGMGSYWEHSNEVESLASFARLRNIKSFSMEFSARKMSKKELEKIRRKKREAEQDKRDFMETDEELVFLNAPLRF